MDAIESRREQNAFGYYVSKRAPDGMISFLFSKLVKKLKLERMVSEETKRIKQLMVWEWNSSSLSSFHSSHTVLHAFFSESLPPLFLLSENPFESSHWFHVYQKSIKVNLEQSHFSLFSFSEGFFLCVCVPPSHCESEWLSHVWLFVTPMNCSPLGSSVHGILQARILRVGCHFLLHGTFPAKGLNLGLPQCRQILYHLSH